MNTRASTYALSALLLLGLGSACGSSNSGTGNQPPPSPALRAHLVNPAETDSAIDTALEPHQSFVNLDVGSNGRVLLFLPGTDAQPRAYQRLLTEAASRGYHALGLSYPNQESLVTRCGDDLACYEPVRLDLFDGGDRDGRVSVTVANSILNRLSKALAFLAATFPDEGWEPFLRDGQPRFDLIAVSGHSQGGGEAGIIAKVREVPRVALFSAPVDGADGVPAGWVNAQHATPSSRYFAFGHQADPLFAQIDADWSALGLAAANTIVTDRLVQQPHNSTAVDQDTPLDANGTPAFRDVWDVLLGP